MVNDVRLQQLQGWLQKQLDCPSFKLEAMTNGASFRRYFRLNHNGQNYIVVDAPPDREASGLFALIARALIKLGINVPQILAQDLHRGFLLISDLGSRLYLQMFDTYDPGQLYHYAIDTLLMIQECKDIPGYRLPVFDQNFITSELGLFDHWFLRQQLGLSLSCEEEEIVSQAYEFLNTAVATQPQVFIHRDYHSRNLILLDDNAVGVLDFQDAMWGPVTYDIVSLLRDCYISWPEAQVKEWALLYWRQAQDNGMMPQCSQQKFLYWFDLMGIQRHLKAVGIFARLNKRDNKSAYLGDIPRTLSYVGDIGQRYIALKPFIDFLHTRVSPEVMKQ
ncbi:MAG: phosphotransferase [Gammaproteobacteria bacterium]